MLHSNRITPVMLMCLMLCLCLAGLMPALGEAGGVLIAYSALDEISEHGNVRLVTDRKILLQDLEAAGIECGDRVKVTFLDQAMDVPVVMNFSEVSTGDALVRVKDDAVELAINMGEFASEYIADKSTAEDGTVTWVYKEGIEGAVAFRIERLEQGGRGEGGSLQLTYTDERSDYPQLNDEAFANFRRIATTGMGVGALYRTSSPIDPEHRRNACADTALKKAGVATIMNLVNSREAVSGFENYGETYYSTTDFIALGMGMSFETDAFKGGLADGLRFFISHEGPYAVHCQEGKDRTGVVAALLEAFMGASYEEIRRDYMVSFYNYYGIQPGDAAYDQIAENNIATTLRKLFAIDSLEGVDLAAAAEAYFRAIGLSDGELEQLRANLGKSWSAESAE